MINQDDLNKLEQFKQSLESQQVNVEVGDKDNVEAEISETGNSKMDIKNETEQIENEHVVKEEVKPEVKKGRRKTEDIVQGLLDELYDRIEELIRVELDHVSYRIYNSVKAEVRRQLRGGNNREWKDLNITKS